MNIHQVVFVDDDLDDREFIADCIQDLNEQERSLILSSGEELLGYLSAITDETNYPSLIVLDINMQGMDGAQTLLKLKRNDRLQKIPVVLFSTAERPKGNLVALGAEDCYQKPSFYAGMKDTVRAFFERALTKEKLH